MIEIDKGCAARAGRSLWEGLMYVRSELQAWGQPRGRRLRLAGFSTHYNVSFELDRAEQGRRRTVGKLARLLTEILPAPVMLLATNRRSTGVGVRPRGNRIEVTVDFTPNASMMIATATVITAIVRAVMEWDSYELDELSRRGIPRFKGLIPIPHTSRKGWLARNDCYPASPFTCDIDQPCWEIETRGVPEWVSLRALASRIARIFLRPIVRLADPFSLRLIDSVMRGKTASMLDLEDRPPAYEDAGDPTQWNEVFSVARLERSRYESVLIRAITGRRLRVGGRAYTATGMRGWTDVIFTRQDGGERRVLSIDYLLDHLADWRE